MEEVEEMSSVFWEFFKVLTKEGKVQAVKVRLTRVQVCSIKKTVTHLIDHTQCALKHSIKDLWDFSCDVDPKFVYDGCHGAEDLRLSCSWDVSLVVDEHSLQQGRHKVVSNLRTEKWACRQINEDNAAEEDFKDEHRLTI